MFSGLVSKIPKSGAWLVYAKKVMGTLLFGAALYFLRTVLPYQVFRPLVLVCLLVASLYFAFLERTPVTTKNFRAVRLGLALIFFATALWWSNPGKGEVSAERISWAPYSEAALAQASAAGQPVVLYFHAEWCVACKELDRVSLSDSRVVEASREFMMLQADMTRVDSPEAVSTAFQYSVWGFPTLVFFGGDGREMRELRIVEFVPPEELLDRFRKLKRGSREK
jgi:thiol:disulfide interchange protein DsbD